MFLHTRRLFNYSFCVGKNAVLLYTGTRSVCFSLSMLNSIFFLFLSLYLYICILGPPPISLIAQHSHIPHPSQLSAGASPRSLIRSRGSPWNLLHKPNSLLLGPTIQAARQPAFRLAPLNTTFPSLSFSERLGLFI